MALLLIGVYVYVRRERKTRSTHRTLRGSAAGAGPSAIIQTQVGYVIRVLYTYNQGTSAYEWAIELIYTKSKVIPHGGMTPKLRCGQLC